MKFFGNFSGVVICFLVLVSTAEAAAYKVTPLVIDKDVSQRDIFSETVRIENTARHKVTIFPAVNEIVLDDGGDITNFIETAMTENKDSAITTWITMSRAPLDLDPGEVVELPVSFRIHQNAPAGHYQALLSFGTGRNRAAAEEAVKAGIAPGVVVTLAVEQNLSESLKLGSFIIDKFVTAADNQAVEYTMANPGEVAVTPTGEIILYNSHGEEVGALPVNPDQMTLTPGQKTTLKAAVPVAGYLGKYKAFLSINYGTTQAASVYDTVFYYVVPWQKLLIAFVVVLIVAIILTVIFSRRYQGEDAEDQHGADYLPVHVLQGVSKEEDHDINLKT